MRKRELQKKYDALEIEHERIKTRNAVLENMFETNSFKISEMEAKLKKIGEIIDAYRASL